MKLVFTLALLFVSCISLCQNFDIYVSDAGNFSNPPWKIVKYDSSGQNPVTFINSNLNWPQDILFMEDSNVVLISSLGTGVITRHDINTGSFINNFATGIGGPTRIKIGPDSLLYVLQWTGNGKVKRYQLDGTFVDDFTSVGVLQSIGLDWDSSNNLYVSSYNGKYVRKFDASGNDMGLFISSNLLGPTNIWFDTNGDLLVADYNGTSVKRFDPSGNFIGDFIQGLSNCEGVAYLPNGNILIGNGGTSSVKMFDPNGNYISDLISSGAGGLITPNAINIRISSSTSIEGPNEKLNQIIYPSIGNTFYLAEAYLNKIKSVELVNSAGDKVFHTTSIKNPIIKEYTGAGGIYLIKLHFENEVNSITQKIIIQQK